jgi:hypothetical protein
MSLINEGLNRRSNSIGSMGAMQDKRKKMNEEERREFEKNRLKFDVQTQEFPDLISAMYIESQELAHAVTVLMRTVFNDFYGTQIEISNNRELIASVYFTDIQKGEGFCKAIEPVLGKDDLNTSEGQFQAINQYSSFGRRNSYKFTKDASQILLDIVPNSAINRDSLKIDWNKIMAEGTMFSSNGFNSNQLYVRILIDLNKVLKAMFGSGKEGEDMRYMVSVGNPINPTISPTGEMVAKNWQLFVMRCEAKSVGKMAQSLGLIYGNGAELGIVTD